VAVADEAPADDAAAVKQLIKDYYSIYFTSLDKPRYRSLLTEDYRLLEDGEILDTEGDIGFMPKPEDDYKRTDSFDFRYVKVQGDVAYAVYFLKSAITDRKEGARTKEYLESAILRRSAGAWRMALLHSTRVSGKPPNGLIET
ncbi:MAG TPA: nuclear transport factor 2 family protein, partial [Gemmatimonadaceae bacterium]|nr:nuclear transport factor 2 family protein [Gemmatimonadaceae bacterium]